jgi:lysophospholipase L1-like esterase
MPPAPGLTNNTLRQIVRVSVGGKQLRLKFSNAFGNGPVEIQSVHLALCPGDKATSEIAPSTDKALAFHGSPSITIAPGDMVWSDPLDFDLPALTNLTVTTYFGAVPAKVTGHPGSRTTSYILPGNAVTSTNMAEASKTAHWYFLTTVDVMPDKPGAAVVALGDSITDGRGTTTDGNNRWTDMLAARLHGNPATAGVSVLNMGIGGNGIFGGLGPAAKNRFDGDVLEQSGVRWFILFEGVNDIGGGHNPAIATNLIAAYQQFIEKAHARNVRAYGATITPFGQSFYYSPAHEAAREEVNTWIRTNGLFDAVIDFDAAVRDPVNQTNLQTQYDVGDHLHLNPAGYRALGETIDLKLFSQ